MKKVGILIALILFSVLVALPAAFAVVCTSCSNCTLEAAKANAELELNQSITTTSSCVTIGADNVTLDCQGFQIKGDFASGTTGDDGIIVEGVDNATITNCRVFEMDDDGIRLRNTTGTTVRYSNFTTNFNFGIDISLHVFNTIIENNSFFDNFVHIKADKLNRSIIRNNTFKDVCSGCGSAAYTIQLNADNDFNNITFNHFDNNSQTIALRVVGSTNDNNTISNNNFRQRGIQNAGTNTLFCQPNTTAGIGNYYRSNIGGSQQLSGPCGLLTSAVPAPTRTKFNGGTSNFSTTDSFQTALFLEIVGNGSLEWNATINVEHQDFDRYVNIGNNLC